MKLTAAIEERIAAIGARVRLGYPWWLRPWLARDVIAITLGRTIYLSSRMAARSEDYVEKLLRHELAHVRQVLALGLPRFLWRYTTEFLGHFRRLRSVQAAYAEISFEIEARAEEETGSGTGL